MINRFLILVVTGVIALSTAALCADAGKDNLSIFLNTGYGAGIGGYLIDSTHFTNSTNRLIKNQEHYLNYGGGINLSVGANYKLLENLFAQAALRFAWGVPSIKAETVNGILNTSYNTTYKPGMWGINIMVLPRIRVIDLFEAYTGVGCGIYFSYCDIEDSRAPNIKGSISTWPALGLSGLIGAEYPVMDELILFGEISYDAMSFTITKLIHPNVVTAFNYVPNSLNNELPPYNIPGTNIALRIGARFIVF